MWLRLTNRVLQTQQLMISILIIHFGRVIAIPVCMGISKTATNPEKHQVVLIELEVLQKYYNPSFLGIINASGFCIFVGIREVFRHDIASIRQRFSLWMHSGDFPCIGSNTQQGRKHLRTGGFESILGTENGTWAQLCMRMTCFTFFWYTVIRMFCLLKRPPHLLGCSGIVHVVPSYCIWSNFPSSIHEIS